MGWMWLAVALASVAAIGLVWIARLPKRKKKRFVKKTTRRAWEWMERRGIANPNPAFLPDRLAVYPELEILEQNWQVIRKECEQLVETGDHLTPMKDLGGGGITSKGIHRIGWKTFMFKSGGWVEENCRRAPETTRLLKQVPRVGNAFFSVLEPHQHIVPHFGYYKGFLRYHLGLIVPYDNAEKKCWIRVSEHGTPGNKRDVEAIEKGEKYYWHEGEGVLFDDTYLHEANNETDQVRVVLFLDMLKPLNGPFDIFSRVFFWIASFDPSMRKIRKAAVAQP